MVWAEVRDQAWERLGVRRFRRGQRDLIEAALTRRDSVGLMQDQTDKTPPTGPGSRPR